MPTYEFRCRTCDTSFEERRSMTDSALLARCPQGHDDTVKLLSVFASVGGKPSSSVSGKELANAMATPKMGGGCGAACGCH
jgi:putative FmdB family regulatory protein